MVSSLILLMGIVGIRSLQHVAAVDEVLFKLDTVPIVHLLSVDESFQRARVNVRDYILARSKEDKAHYRTQVASFRSTMDREAAAYEQTITSKDARDLFSAWKAADSEYVASEQEAMGLADAGHTDEALTTLMGPKRKLAQAAADSLGKLSQLIVHNAETAAASNLELAQKVTRQSIVIVVGGTSAALAFSLLISLSITRRLVKGVRNAERIASGDFTSHLEIKRQDEIGSLAQSLNTMAIKLSGMVATIQQNAEQLAAASEQISASSQRLSEGAQSQASSLEETSASVEELTASVEQVAEHAQSQAAAAEEGTSSMTQALGTIEEVSKSLEQITTLAKKSVDSAAAGAKAVQSVVEGVRAIAESSQRIGGIVEALPISRTRRGILSILVGDELSVSSDDPVMM